MRRFPKTEIGDRAPQTNPAYWSQGRGSGFSATLLPPLRPGQLVRVTARRGPLGGWHSLPEAGVVIKPGKTSRGQAWYQVLVEGVVHELWAEELEGVCQT